MHFFRSGGDIDIDAQIEAAGAFQFVQIKSETSPGASPLTRTWVGVTTRASATVGSVTETRFSLSVVLMSRDLPTMTRKGAAPGVTPWPEAVEVVVVCAGVSWLCEEAAGEEAEAVAGSAGVWTSAAAARANAGVANIVVAPSSKTTAARVRTFMKSDLCEAARANASRL